MMRRLVTATICACMMLVTSTAGAQDWTGLYVGGTIGAGIQSTDASETIRFDTNLDGRFTDTVRTTAGADAFSSGFCGGLAVNATAAGGCTDDSDGVDVGGRIGYDWQFGRFVIGALADVSRTDVTDSVTAFSTTPAFYSFTREAKSTAGLRGRMGVANARMLVYGTAGLAWSRIEQSFTTSNAVNTFVMSDDDDDADDDDEGPTEMVPGYQAGGGVDIRVGGRWTVTGEYLFTSLNDREESTIRARGPAPATNPFILGNAAGTDFQRTDKFEFHAVRAGLTLRF